MISTHELRDILGKKLSSLVLKQFTDETDKKADNIEEKLDECIKYLYLTSKYHDKLTELFLPTEQIIDDIWHYLIIQTREYNEFCAKLPGHFFIHHRSIPFDEYIETKENREQTLKEFLIWIPHYVENFGPFTEKTAKYWTVVKFLNENFNMPFSEINQLKDIEREDFNNTQHKNVQV